jgi:hypothetical protein
MWKKAKDSSLYDPSERNERVISLLVTFLVGGIHCAAWSFHFRTDLDQLIWQVSSISLIALPSILFIALTFAVVFEPIPLAPIVFLLFAAVYSAVRITTMVVAWRSLASPEPEVFKAVHWTTFIPHI